jgi:hypothetical protein
VTRLFQKLNEENFWALEDQYYPKGISFSTPEGSGYIGESTGNPSTIIEVKTNSETKRVTDRSRSWPGWLTEVQAMIDDIPQVDGWVGSPPPWE